MLPRYVRDDEVIPNEIKKLRSSVANAQLPTGTEIRQTADVADFAKSLSEQLETELAPLPGQLQEALTEAANALEAAGLARSEAADALAAAQSAVNDVASAVDAAQAATEAATEAATAANGKSSVVRSPSAATAAGSYKAGDQWWQFSGENIVGLWLHSGTAWVSQVLTNAIIATLDAAKITTGILAADRIGALSITAAKLAAGSVIAEKIGALAVTAEKIAASAVTAVKIAANAVTAEKINAGAVTTTKLDALAVTAEKIAVGAIIAEKIAVGAITTAKLAATAIDGMTITGATIIQQGSSPTAGIYPHPMADTVPGWGAMGVGSFALADHTLSGHTSTKKVVVTQSTSAGNAGAMWAVPNVYMGATIRITVAIRRATAGQVWISGVAVPTSGTSVAANTWVNIQSTAFVAAGGVWISVGALGASVEITEPRVTVVTAGTTKATLATDPTQGPSLIWSTGGIDAGTYRADGIALQMVNPIYGGTFLFAADPTGISFISRGVSQPLSYVRSIDTDSNLQIGGAGWTRLTSPSVTHVRDLPWAQATAITGPWSFLVELKNGWGNNINVNWDGLQTCRRLGMVYITGAVTKASAFTSLEVLAVLPPPLRPEIPCLLPAAYVTTGGYVLVRTNGEIVTAQGGAGGQIAIGGSLTPNWVY